ncbi:MAG: FGGY-family carbohydrate kinase [Planctomycetota bacterium]
MAEYLMGIDNGGTVSKAAIFTLDGKEVAVAARKTETLTPKPGFAERDMENAWQATAEAISEAIKKSGILAENIVAIACAGHGNGIYLIDGDGKPVRGAIMSHDGRARKYIDEWLADGVDKVIRPKTMQSIWPAQPNALLAWLRDNEPESITKTKWVLMCKDYIRYRLTGEVYAELTDMSGTSLMNVGTGEYDPDVLKAFGISEFQELLPPLKLTADICGQITKEAAELTGLKEGTPVAGGMFDIDACGLASGIVNESQLCMVAGTWGNNQYISDKPVVDEDVFMTSCYSIPGYYLMLEGSATSASNLEWFLTEFFEAERELARKWFGEAGGFKYYIPAIFIWFQCQS